MLVLNRTDNRVVVKRAQGQNREKVLPYRVVAIVPSSNLCCVMRVRTIISNDCHDQGREQEYCVMRWKMRADRGSSGRRRGR